MPEETSSNNKFSNKNTTYVTIDKPTSDIFGKIACVGTSTSRKEYQAEEFLKIVELTKALKFSFTYFYTPGALNRFNNTIKLLSNDMALNRELCINLALSIFNPSVLYKNESQQSRVQIDPCLREALEFEEGWLAQNYQTINKENLIILSSSLYFFHKCPQLFNEFPKQLEIFKEFSSQINLKDLYNGYSKSAKFILNRYNSNKLNTKKQAFTNSTKPNPKEKAEAFIDNILESLKNEKPSSDFSQQSDNNKFRKGLIEGALVYVKRKREEYIKQHSTNNPNKSANEVAENANKIYSNQYAIVCSILYLLAEYIDFYHYTKKLSFNYYVYLGELKGLPGDKAFSKHIIQKEPTIKELFKYLGLKIAKEAEFNDFISNLEKLQIQTQGPFPYNSFPAARTFSYLPSQLQQQPTPHIVTRSCPTSPRTEDQQQALVTLTKEDYSFLTTSLLYYTVKGSTPETVIHCLKILQQQQEQPPLSNNSRLGANPHLLFNERRGSMGELEPAFPTSYQSNYYSTLPDDEQSAPKSCCNIL